MADNLHEGHRKRLKKELLEQGFSEATPPHKILEVVLFYGVPRKDTNPLAHELIDKFGSLAGVFEADPHDLMQVKGITENAVTLIKMFMPVARRVYMEKYKKGYKFNSIEECGEHLVKRFFGYNEEAFIVSSFDSAGCFICDDIIGIGDADSVSISVKNIVRTVIQRNPTTIIISHNHINSPAMPSIADLEMTQSLKYTLEQINVRLLDHIIVSGNDYVSMKQSANYSHIF